MVFNPIPTDGAVSVTIFVALFCECVIAEVMFPRLNVFEKEMEELNVFVR
jgi:hypothetical protein